MVLTGVAVLAAVLLPPTAAQAQVRPRRPPPPSTPGAPSTPPARVCGNQSVLQGPSTPPAGATPMPAGTNGTTSTFAANTTYWLAPGVHTIGGGVDSQFDPARGDTFVGAPGAVLSGQGDNDFAFGGNAPGVTIKYLTIEQFVAPENEGVVNQGSASGWTIRNDTIEDNPAGAGVMLGTNNVLTVDCLTRNGQYGFQSYSTTAGPRHVTVTDDEISFNATADYTGRTSGCGCSGGAKFWDTQGATVTGNYVHDNRSVGLWADTDNTGVDFSRNYFADNDGPAIQYEISYNASITDNTFVGNAVVDGPTNPGFPEAAVYVSESGSDPRVPGPFGSTFDISDNVFVDNWSGVVLWENANRYCGSSANTSTGACTLVTPRTYTPKSCARHVPSSTPGQTPDYYGDCRWRTQNVTVSHNVFTYTPARVGHHCTAANECGFNGLFSEYGTYRPFLAWTVPNDVANDQDDHFVDNKYRGPWRFVAFAQGSTVSWAQWSKGFADASGSGDRFTAQDAGSSYAGRVPSR
jgi:Right handed beta helix region